MDALQLMLDLHEARNQIERVWKILSGGKLRFHTALILKVLHEHPDIRPIEVRRRTGIPQTELERLQRVLEGHGLIKRNRINKRHTAFTLTGKGMVQVQAFERRADEMYRTYFGDLASDEVVALHKGLAQLRERSP